MPRSSRFCRANLAHFKAPQDGDLRPAAEDLHRQDPEIPSARTASAGLTGARGFFSLFLDLRGRPVLVLGEGPAAARKAALARRAGAEVRAARAFSPALLDGAALAIGAEAAEDDLAALAAAARARGNPGERR